jgi:hypothetical protein
MEHVQEWSVSHPRIKWTAVWAGLVVGMSAQLVLTLLGLAIGGKRDLQPAEMNKSADKVTNQAKEGQSLWHVTDSALAELQQKLTALDRDAAVNVLVQKAGMSEAQAQQVVQSTIGRMAPLKDTLRDVKGQSIEIGNATLTRVGVAAGWLFLLGLLSFAVSVGGGAVGTLRDGAAAYLRGAFRRDTRQAI